MNKEVDSKIVYEDEQVLVIEDINPQAPMHLLIIPKEHIANTLELSEEHKDLVGHIHLVAGAVAGDMGVAESGFRLVLNCGADAGQAVPHLHFHLLGGRLLGWPPG